MRISMKKTLTWSLLASLLLFLSACTGAQVETRSSFPSLNSTESIATYPLENFTDTPRAGMRAANIVEGILQARGYMVKSRVDEHYRKLSQSGRIADARRIGARYLLTGGVSEWRYKTGIDGEPAVSLHLKLIDTRTGATVWSATGSDSSWGNSSIGVLAQGLISSMLDSRR